MINQTDWLVIHTHAGKEETAAANLINQQIETYLPRIRERRPNGPVKSKLVSKPLFARYLFARFDVERLYKPVSNTRGVASLVTFGGDLASVDDAVIQEIAGHEHGGFVVLEGSPVDSGIGFAVGEVVRIIGGCWDGWQGRFAGPVKGDGCVSVMIDVPSLAKQVAVIVPPTALTSL